MIREYAGTNVSVINTLERSRINKLLNTQSVRSRAGSLIQFRVSFREARCFGSFAVSRAFDSFGVLRSVFGVDSMTRSAVLGFDVKTCFREVSRFV